MAHCYCGDSPEVYNSRTVKARKEHRCDECGCTIRVGESYEYVFAIYYGEKYMPRTCERCVALRVWVLAHVPCLCWTHGNLHEECQEAVDEYAHETTGLIFGWGRRMVAIRRRAREDRAERNARKAA